MFKYEKKTVELENKYFKSNLLKHWSLENISTEAEIMDNTDYSEKDKIDEINNEYDSKNMEPEVDADIPEEENTDYQSDFNPGEFNNGEDVDVSLGDVDETDVVNIMEMSGTLMNTYLTNMDQILRTNKNVIEYSGNIKEHAMYEKFIDPAIKIVLLYSKDTQLEKKINEFMSVMQDKRKMTSICGTKKSPFIYESLQLLLLETLRELLAVMPLAIKNSMSIEDTIEKFGYNQIKKLLEAVVDVVEIKNLFGEKIYYKEPDEAKELSDTNEAINQTVYAQNAAFESMIELSRFLSTYSATESILNLIEIRNNKALMEFSLIMKLCIFITSLVKDVNLGLSCPNVLSKVKDLLTMDVASDADTAKNNVDAISEELRAEVIMPQLNKTADIEVEANDNISKVKEVVE